MTTALPPTRLTYAQFAHLTGISLATVKRRIADKVLRPRGAKGSRPYFLHEDVIAFLNANMEVRS